MAIHIKASEFSPFPHFALNRVLVIALCTLRVVTMPLEYGFRSHTCTLELTLFMTVNHTSDQLKHVVACFLTNLVASISQLPMPLRLFNVKKARV